MEKSIIQRLCELKAKHNSGVLKISPDNIAKFLKWSLSSPVTYDLDFKNPKPIMDFEVKIVKGKDISEII